MAAWTRRYTAEQREALLRAVLSDGMTTAAAVRAAAAGELPGTPAFDVAYSSAAELVRKERDDYELRDPERAMAALEADAIKVARFAHMATKAIEKKVQAGEAIDTIAIKRAAEALTAAKRALGPTPRKTTTKPATAPQDVELDRPENGTGVVASLLAAVETNGNGHSRPRAA